MKRPDKEKLKELSEKRPADPSLKDFSLIDVVSSLSEFIREHFRGLAEVSYDIQDTRKVKIAPEYLAYFLRLLLKEINGREFVKIKAFVFDGNLNVDIKFDNPVFIRREELAPLLLSAKDAGFYVTASENGFLLKAEVLDTVAAMFVYANDADTLKSILAKIFFDK